MKSQRISHFQTAVTTPLGAADRLRVRSFNTGPVNLSALSETDHGTSLIQGMKVFRSGTFKDSMGEQHSWDKFQLAQMVSNFDFLKEQGIFVNPLVRDGHPSFFGGGGDVIGYVSRIYLSDEGETTFVLADFELTEPDALGKLQRGTFRARSAEIGYYETNDEAMFWPVFFGFAFVDIPAVEGLFSNHQTQDFTIVSQKEIDKMGVQHKFENQAGGTGSTGGESEEERNGGGAPGQAGAAAEGGGGAVETPAGQAATETGGGTTENQPQQHAAASQPSFAFSINGQATSDYAAVQAHINSLEGTVAEQRDNARREFVTALANRDLIPATQVDSLTEFALGLSSEQYEQWTGTFPEQGQPAPLFAAHGAAGGGGAPVTTPTAEEDELATAEAIVKNHIKAHMKPDAIKRTTSYKKLEAAGKAPAL